jgi:hypothetical protein
MSVNEIIIKCGRCNVFLNNEKFFYNGKTHKCCFSCNDKRSNRKNICKTCGIRASFNFEGNTIGIYCSKCAEPGMINVKEKRICKAEGCSTRPTYNFEGETKGLYCKDCAKPGMIDVKHSRCKAEGCSTRPSYNFEGETKGLYCSGCAEPGMINVVNPKCKAEGCSTIPSYNFEGETKGIYCSKCAEPGMVDVKHPKCKAEGCSKRPNFNFEGETKGLYCSDCKEPGMVDVVEKRICKAEGCSKQPSFNFEGETKGLYCSDCKEPGMVDVIHPRCKAEGCSKHPTFNFEGESKALYCSKCAEPGMINVVEKRICKAEGCSKRPSFNFEGETKGLYCSGCAEPGMINVKEKRICKAEGCSKQPTFNFEGETKGLYCSKCAEPDMINVKSPRCKAEGCSKQPTFNFEGEKKGIYCSGCAESGMVDVKSPRCKAEGCKTRASYGIPCNFPSRCAVHKQEGMIIRPRGKCTIKNCNQIATHGIHKPIHCENHKTDNDVDLVERKCTKCGSIDIIINGLCVNFCGLTEKHKELKKHQKIKEKRVLKIVEANFMKPTEYNVRVDRGCGGVNSEEKEIGFDFGNFKVFLEVDENRHKSYCELGEVNRMKNIYMNEGGIPIVFIRYNPDNFKDDNNKTKKLSQAKREEILIKWLKKYKNDGLKHNLSVNYLFYDGWKEGEIFEYEIEPYSTEQEFKCDKTNKIFYIKSQYEEHLKKLNQSNQ